MGRGKRKVEGRTKHSKRRAWNRYGISLNKLRRRELVKMIQEGEGTFVKQSANNSSIWKLEVEGQDVLVVYDKTKKDIATFLPKDAWEWSLLEEKEDEL